MIYYSNYPRKYFQTPENLIFEEGDYSIYTLDKKNILVDKASILPYEITKSEAQKYLFKEINKSANDFINAVKSKTGQATDQEAEETDYLDSERLSKKTKEGVAFLGDMAETLKVIWGSTKTDDEVVIAENRKKLLEIKERLNAKGIPLDERFENIPEKLREKYANQKGENTFKESAEKFEEGFSKLKESFNAIFKKKSKD